MKINIPFEVLLPSVPNFVRTVDGDKLVDVANLSDPQIVELGKLWVVALQKHAASRRSRKARP